MLCTSPYAGQVAAGKAQASSVRPSIRAHGAAVPVQGTGQKQAEVCSVQSRAFSIPRRRIAVLPASLLPAIHTVLCSIQTDKTALSAKQPELRYIRRLTKSYRNVVVCVCGSTSARHTECPDILDEEQGGKLSLTLPRCGQT